MIQVSEMLLQATVTSTPASDNRYVNGEVCVCMTHVISQQEFPDFCCLFVFI